MTATTLPERLEALRGVVELGEGRLDGDVLDRASGVLMRAGQRLQLSGEHTVAALAGATGSGKSSLFNALAGAELSSVGVRRPTTANATAAVWGLDGVDPLLDWLAVPSRHEVNQLESDELGGLVLLDLPDHDSTALTHRLEVDRLVELVDLLIWVVDPQKYADAALHERYLRRLATHDDVTLVVLNQIDRLAGGHAVDACIEDLERLLREDGLAATSVVGVSARMAIGLDDLRSVLQGAVRKKEAFAARISADLDRLATDLTNSAHLTGVATPGRIGRRERVRLVDALCAAAGVPAVTSAAGGSYFSAAIAATGWPFTRWVRKFRPDPLRKLHLPAAGSDAPAPARAGRTSLPTSSPVVRSQVDSAVRGVVESVTDGLPEWEIAAVRRVATPRAGDLTNALDRAVADTDLGVARRPYWWAMAGTVQWGLAAAAVAGTAWLVLLFGVQWLQLPKPPTYEVGRLSLPTLLFLGGIAGGLLVATACRLLAEVGAARRRKRADRRLRATVEQVADTIVLLPVRQEIDAYCALLDRVALLR